MSVPYGTGVFEVVVIGSIDDHGSGDLSGELDRVKSVLLYADVVTVESFRPAFLAVRMLNQIRTVKTRLGPYVEALDPVDLDRLSIDLADDLRIRRPDLLREFDVPLDPRVILEGPETISELMQESGDSFDTARFFRRISQLAVQRWVEFKPAERPAAAVAAIRDLNSLVDAGLVLLDPGPVGALHTVAESDVHEEGLRLLDRAVRRIYGPGDPIPLLDDSRGATIDAIGRRDGSFTKHSRSHAAQVEIAAHLIGSLPNLRDLPIDELLDVRETVAPHVSRFRAAVAELEQELDEELAADQFDAAVTDIRMRLVEPELEALTDSLRETRLLPTIARAVPLSASGVVALAATTAAGAPTLAAAAAVGVGLTAAAAQEYLRRENKDSERRKHRMFLLHRAGRAAKR